MAFWYQIDHNYYLSPFVLSSIQQGVSSSHFQVAFRAKVGKKYQLPHKGIIPEEFGVVCCILFILVNIYNFVSVTTLG